MQEQHGWRRTHAIWYAWGGASLGLLLSLTAAWLALVSLNLSAPSEQLWRAPSIHPWVWTMNVIASVLLGLLGRWIGLGQERLSQQNAALSTNIAELSAQVAVQQHAAAELWQNEKWYRSLFEHANDAIGIFSPDGRFVAVNPKLVELTGFPAEQLIGQTPERFFGGDFAYVLARIEQIMREGALGPYEVQVTASSGKKFFSVNAFAQVENGRPVGVISIIRDVTEERRRKEHEALYQLTHALAHTTDLRLMADHLFVHTQMLLKADYGCVMLAEGDGSTLRGVAAYGMDSTVFQQERFLSTEQAPAVAAFQQKQAVVVGNLAHSPLISEQLRQQYGVTGSFWAVPLMSGEQAVGVFGVGYRTPREATTEELQVLQMLGNEAALAMERARLTEELVQSERRFRALFNQTFQFIGLLTPEGIFLEANETALSFGGLLPEEVYGRPLWEAGWILPKDRERLQAAVAAAARGELVRFELDVQGAGGMIGTIDFSLKPFHDEAGRVVLLIPEGRDITERKQMEESLRQSEARFQRIAANFPGGMIFQFVLRPDGSVVFPYISANCRELYELEPEEAQRDAALTWS